MSPINLCLSNCLIGITALSLSFNAIHNDHRRDIEYLEHHYDKTIAQLIQAKEDVDSKYNLELEKLTREKEDLTKVVVNSKVIKAEVSAYTASKNETDKSPNETATMKKPIPGKTCAVSRDLKHLLGKNIYIDGVGVRTVNDLTAKRFKKKIDICMTTKSQAIQFGILSKKIIVL
jgi:3D (Asp-Asp-Asp) domain-containing protein